MRPGEETRAVSKVVGIARMLKQNGDLIIHT